MVSRDLPLSDLGEEGGRSDQCVYRVFKTAYKQHQITQKSPDNRIYALKISSKPHYMHINIHTDWSQAGTPRTPLNWQGEYFTKSSPADSRSVGVLSIEAVVDPLMAVMIPHLLLHLN